MSAIHYPSRCWFVDLVLDREGTHPVLEGDDKFKDAARAMRAEPSWDDGSLFEGDDNRFSARFRDPLGPQSVALGTDLPGSWHQQANGGERRWASVAGEFEWR